MLYLNQTYELLTGGYYSGNSSWNKGHTEIDNCFKLYLLTQGEVFVGGEKESFTLEKNKLYFINGSKLNHQHCKQSFSTHWLHFIPKDLIIYQGLLSLPTVVELPTDKINLAHSIANIEQLFTLHISSSWKYPFQILHIQTLLQTIILELFAQYPITEQSISFETKRIEPAIQYMNQHYKETIQLKQLAGLCCMSPNYFHKVFKTALNTTPANYLTLLRMNAALQLITNDQQTIKDIAYELGFTDDAHFCRSFKKFYGIPPGKYKKERGNVIL